jgi:hypothetical protein
VKRALAEALVAHHLRLFGAEKILSRTNVQILAFADQDNAEAALLSADQGGIVVALLPCENFLSQIGVKRHSRHCFSAYLSCAGTSVVHKFNNLKTLHEYGVYDHPRGITIVCEIDRSPVWLWVPVGRGGILLIGTDLPGDLIRYRQGDPAQAENRPTGTQWGIAGERPNYLFESQLIGEDGTFRHADYWAMVLAETLANLSDEPLQDVLPGGAPGAIVFTGDDDQAYLKKYEEQMCLLEGMPITYLLHPLTRHTRKTIRMMQRRNPNIDFGIHPDALDAAANYDAMLAKQLVCYRELTGAPPLSLRNHGFLNDGYWGHLDSWLMHGIRISSNLPGLDGRVLNGSLLPARMVWKGNLTDHWSILTAIGDGVRFISGMSDKDAANLVWTVADRIRSSGLPGVMVLNLHPQNVSETRAMHEAAKEIIRSGFVAWNLGQCLKWFDLRDSSIGKYEDEKGSWFARQWVSFRERISQKNRVMAS